MTIDQVDQTVVAETPVTPAGEAPAASQQTVQTESRHTTRSRPEGSELTRRITVLVFGLIQIVIGARIILSGPQCPGSERTRRRPSST